MQRNLRKSFFVFCKNPTQKPYFFANLHFECKKTINKGFTYKYLQGFSFMPTPGNFAGTKSKMMEIIVKNNTEPAEVITILSELDKLNEFYTIAKVPLPFQDDLIKSFVSKCILLVGQFSNSTDFYNCSKSLLNLSTKHPESARELVLYLSKSEMLFGIKKSQLTELIYIIHVMDSSIIKDFYLSFLHLINKYADEMKISSLIYFLGLSNAYLENYEIPQAEQQIFKDILSKNSKDIMSIIKSLEPDNLVRLLSLTFNYLENNREEIMKSCLNHIEKNHAIIQIPQILSLLHILTSIKYENEELWFNLAENILVNIQSFSANQLIKIINCFTYFEYNHKDLFEEMIHKLKILSDQIKPKEIPILFQSLSSIQVKVDELAQALRNTILDNTSNYSINELVIIFSCFSQFNATDIDLCKEFEKIFIAKKDQLNFQLHFEGLINGFLNFSHNKCEFFEILSSTLENELQNGQMNKYLDSAILVSIFAIMRESSYFEGKLGIITNYCERKLEKLESSDLDFVLNLGGLLGANAKILMKYESLIVLAKFYLDKVPSFRDQFHNIIKSQDLATLQGMIFRIRNDLNHFRK